MTADWRRVLTLVLLATLAITGVGIASADISEEERFSSVDPLDGAVVFDATEVDGDLAVELEVRVNVTETKTLTFLDGNGEEIASTDVDPPLGTYEIVSIEWNNSAPAGPPEVGENSWSAEVADHSTGANSFSIASVEFRDEGDGSTIPASELDELSLSPSDASATETVAIDENPQPLTDIPFENLDERQLTADLSASDAFLSRSYLLHHPGIGDGEFRLATANTTAEILSTTFELIDRSEAQFDSNSGLQITKDVAGEEMQVAGDIWGADNRVNERLVADSRYRVSVVNLDGDRRSFGDYRATADNDFIEIRVGDVGISPDDPGDYFFTASLTELDDNGETPIIRYRWEDAGEIGELGTQLLGVTIVEQNNESNELYSQNYAGEDASSVQSTVALTEEEAEKNWVVRYNYNVLGEDREASGFEVVGGISELDIPVSETMLQTLGIGAILLTAGLFGGTLSRIGGIVVVSVSWMLLWLGILIIPVEFLLAATLVAILFIVGTDDAGGLFT